MKESRWQEVWQGTERVHKLFNLPGSGCRGKQAPNLLHDTVDHVSLCAGLIGALQLPLVTANCLNWDGVRVHKWEYESGFQRKIHPQPSQPLSHDLG